jgi:TolA-binding protein
MRSVPILISAAALVGSLWLAPGRTVAQPRAQDPLALRRAQDEFARLQEQLDRVNTEIERLKRSNRSVRDDYRLRDRLADAEALAQKLTRVEARLRSFGAPAEPCAVARGLGTAILSPGSSRPSATWQWHRRRRRGQRAGEPPRTTGHVAEPHRPARHRPPPRNPAPARDLRPTRSPRPPEARPSTALASHRPRSAPSRARPRNPLRLRRAWGSTARWISAYTSTQPSRPSFAML